MTGRRSLALAGATVLAIALFGCTFASGAERSQIVLRSPGGRMIRLEVEVADDPSERERGLMGRTSLPGDGMLFVFESESGMHFWMKNTLIPLGVLFFDASGAFVSAASMDPCRSDPCPVYASAGPARYAVEVEHGFTEREGIGEGWRMKFTAPSSP